MNVLDLPLFSALRESHSIVLAGAGGGFDIFSGLPLYFGLRAIGKQVYLANLSFSALETATGKRLAPSLLEVTADSHGPAEYFPELYLSRWFHQRGEEVPIFCLDRVGCQPLLEGYRALIHHVHADTIVLIDGGTDSLMRGDEAGLGTPEEDIASIAAADELDLERKFLICLGFGVDSFHGVCHAHALEAVADLTKQGAFVGAFSLLQEMPEVRLYAEAVQAVFDAMPRHPSIVSASILSALEGHYGDHHRIARTRGSALWINPLMTFYWCFRLEPVARRILYLEEVKQTQSLSDVMAVIDTFRKRRGTTRARSLIPDASLASKLSW